MQKAVREAEEMGLVTLGEETERIALAAQEAGEQGLIGGG